MGSVNPQTRLPPTGHSGFRPAVAKLAHFCSETIIVFTAMT